MIVCYTESVLSRFLVNAVRNPLGISSVTHPEQRTFYYSSLLHIISRISSCSQQMCRISFDSHFIFFLILCEFHIMYPSPAHLPVPRRTPSSPSSSLHYCCGASRPCSPPLSTTLPSLKHTGHGKLPVFHPPCSRAALCSEGSQPWALSPHLERPPPPRGASQGMVPVCAGLL